MTETEFLLVMVAAASAVFVVGGLIELSAAIWRRRQTRQHTRVWRVVSRQMAEEIHAAMQRGRQ